MSIIVVMPSSRDDAHLARRSVLFQVFRATCLSACLVDFFLCRDAKYIISDDRDIEQWSAFEGQLISKNFSKCPKDISTLLRLDTWLDGCANRSILFTKTLHGMLSSLASYFCLGLVQGETFDALLVLHAYTSAKGVLCGRNDAVYFTLPCVHLYVHTYKQWFPP